MFIRKPVFLLSLIFLFWFFISVPCLAGAADGGQARVVSEGYVLHKATGTLYYSEVRADSTVLLREGEGRDEAAAALVIPATTLRAIYERAERRLFDDTRSRGHFAVGWEQGTLELSMLRRMDFLLLGGSGLLSIVLLGVTGLLWGRLRRERTRRKMLRVRHRVQVKGQEQERRRLAQELHDGPVQALHGVHMQLAAAAYSSGDGAPKESPMDPSSCGLLATCER